MYKNESLTSSASASTASTDHEMTMSEGAAKLDLNVQGNEMLSPRANSNVGFGICTVRAPTLDITVTGLQKVPI